MWMYTVHVSDCEYIQLHTDTGHRWTGYGWIWRHQMYIARSLSDLWPVFSRRTTWKAPLPTKRRAAWSLAFGFRMKTSRSIRKVWSLGTSWYYEVSKQHQIHET